MGRTITRRCEVKVEFHHVDMMQVVHNSHYFRWFELGRLAIMEDIFPMSWALENRIATPVVMNHCDYLWPAVYGDALIVTTRHRIAERWEGRFSFDHSISNRGTKNELCRGRSEITVVNLATARLVKDIPPDAWARYQALP
jgi:YbgC/YbaW family acyl-CoA thioester hydrolase